MFTTSRCILILFTSPALWFTTGYAQQFMTGKIEKRGTTEIIIGANIINLKQGKHNTSDLGGNYKIPARIGDTIIFSSAGYLPDTAVVAGYMLTESYLVALRSNVVTLQTVQVDESQNYQLDSMQRREDYRFILDKKHPVKLWNGKRPGDGPGLSFSPIGYFSKGERAKRRLKKRLKQEEEDYYIDSRFPVGRVAQLTRLQGDSLRIFMYRYRPSYQFCRSATSQDIFLYINDKVKLFRKGEPAKK
ncbi:MAG: hypothetical protein J0H74_14945 [Chitinophagaceae bacterium]|nr:hypothetical protein [Chitinophagaceae bacterium]